MLSRPLDYQLVVLPPLCVDEDNIADAFEIFDEAFTTVFE
ncbi:hypothetical protein Htur_4066 (plasmid) [Haloterrigena turkmenica DSM 5511]|uniref:Uncharacterized protein n=1 Tax=Haloterrigena turkmenica (strain ATCC 51198 / DSM 5511 / JCM 9101 / NCIMB 13204 / VKM B-1734 / 4k) TaxID=543526 RepID=D2S0K7_HALTV|nr:hypothetical protein Htur_4066 [Haloterrigena turkmenica DSM 5511]